MRSHSIIRAGALVAGLAVVSGAFGAHALADRLVGKAAEHWDLAVRYQMYHGLALLLSGLLASQGFRTTLAARCHLLGTVVFSGSLYCLALGSPRWFGAVTPIGGSLLIVGWLSLALGQKMTRTVPAADPPS